MGITFKKPETKASKLDPGTQRQNWTNRKEILSPGLMIAYRDRGAGNVYPTQPVRDRLLGAAEAARTIMRKAVREMDRVVFFRRNEGQAFTNVMNFHFGLAAGRSPGVPASNVVDKSFSARDIGATDRRWALNKIREGMLSISFHLNTGMYLIDCDNDWRDVKSGTAGTSNIDRTATGVGTGGRMLMDMEEGYCTWARYAQPGELTGLEKGLLSAWKNGEIHIAFNAMHDCGYSYDAIARVIIHEAAHKYLGVSDRLYAHAGGYDALSFAACIDNADSFAWAALSLHAGHLIKGTDSHDDVACPLPIA